MFVLVFEYSVLQKKKSLFIDSFLIALIIKKNVIGKNAAFFLPL